MVSLPCKKKCKIQKPIAFIKKHPKDQILRKRILRKASTHYATLRVVLHQIFKALQTCDKIIAINSALEGGDYKQLLNVTGIKTINNSSHANTVVSDSDTSGPRDPDLESKLTTEHACLIAKYEKEIFNFCDCSVVVAKDYQVVNV